MPTTAQTPKCFAEIAGQRLLDWGLDAFRQNGVNDITFIGGYRIEVVQEAYPEFTFRYNSDWPNNNILASLLYAEDLMDEPFVCCYSDILFTPEIVAGVLQCREDIALGVDTGWLARYEQRTEHPSADAEKVTVGDGVVTRIHREIPEACAYGEFIGLAKFSTCGAAALRREYHRRREEFVGRPYRGARVFEKAYLIHLLQDMIESGTKMVHADTSGGYVEVDTQQDFEYARQFWTERHLGK